MEWCSGESWLEMFGCLLVSPQTSVDLLVTLISAGAAAGIAIWVLRRQFRHDRELVREQVSTDLALSHAATQRPYVVQLGNALIDLATARHDQSSGADGANAWNNSDREESRNFFNMWNRVEKHLPLPDAEVVWDLWRELARRWRVSHESARVAILPPASQAGMEAAGTAVDHLMARAEIRTQKVGALLLSWDGVSDLDLTSVLDGWEHVPPRAAEEEAYLERMRGEFFAEMLQRLEGDGPVIDVTRERLEQATAAHPVPAVPTSGFD